MTDLRIADAPELTTIEGDEKIPTGNSGGNFAIVTDALAQFVKDSKDLQSGAEVDAKLNPVEMEVSTHVADLANPHQVTKTQVGLGNVDNTADADKPISSAVAAAITTLTTNKADKTYVDSQLTLKADKLTTYNKTEVDTALSLKANQSTTYTKVEVDTKIADKQEKLSIDGVLTGTNTYSNVPNLDGLDGNPSSVMNQQAQALMNRTENLRYSLKTGLNYFDSSYATSIGGYPLNARLSLANGDIVISTIPSNTNNPNSDMIGWVKENSASRIVDGQTTLSNLVLTPEYFGAVAGETDSSNALNAAIVFCAANNYILDGRGKSYNANSLVLKDNTHIKRISINSNLYDTMNSVLTTDYGMLTPLKNVTLDTVYIDGKRELHTNVGTTMDGGRCAVLIRRPIDGLRIINSKLNNAVTDGLMLFPVDWAITEADWLSFVKNVQVVNTELYWNGRWGSSADSVDGLLFENVRAKFNGLDVAGGGDYTTGKSARLDSGRHYGGAIAIEEYHGFSYSKNMVFRGGDYTENAASSLVMTRTGAITTANRNITLDNLRLDFGTLNEAYPNKSIIIGGYSTTNTKLSYRNLIIKNCNFGNGIAELIGCDSTYLSELFDVSGVILTWSVVNTDKYYNFTISDSFSNFYDTGFAARDKRAYFVGYNNQQTVVNFYNEAVIGKSVSLNIFDGGDIRSGLRFEKDIGGYNMHLLLGSDPILTIGKYGSYLPLVDNVVQIGEPANRISKLYSHTMSVVSLPVFASNAAAKSGGLVVGDFYRTSTGQVMVVF